jgi:hypothetical protein
VDHNTYVGDGESGVIRVLIKQGQLPVIAGLIKDVGSLAVVAEGDDELGVSTGDVIVAVNKDADTLGEIELVDVDAVKGALDSETDMFIFVLRVAPGNSARYTFATTVARAIATFPSERLIGNPSLNPYPWYPYSDADLLLHILIILGLLDEDSLFYVKINS